jgi:hypothetical protein
MLTQSPMLWITARWKRPFVAGEVSGEFARGDFLYQGCYGRWHRQQHLPAPHVYFGRVEAVLLERERIKRQRIANRRLQQQLPSTRKSLPVTNILSGLSNAPRALRLPLKLTVRVEAEVGGPRVVLSTCVK